MWSGEILYVPASPVDEGSALEDELIRAGARYDEGEGAYYRPLLREEDYMSD